jgi:(1->4)-alpha-D-glucan 1-alpha-D-glucosylmutase
MQTQELRTVAAYRVQFHPGFPFAAASRIVEYLKELGVSILYASPILQAKKGSQHGYDGIDPCTLNPELGSLEELVDLRAQLSKAGIGWIQDIVPNHAAFSFENKCLGDVFEHGELSPFQHLFDIDWEHPELKGKVLVPTLGDLLHRCIERQEIKLRYEDGHLRVHYWDRVYPVTLSSWSTFLCCGNVEGVISLEQEMREDESHYGTFIDCMLELQQWPPSEDVLAQVDIRFLADRRKQKVRDLYENSPKFRSILDRALEFYNSDDALSKTMLRELMDQQNYKLTYWRFANGLLNYRRFFNINDLIALRMHDPAVFQFVHEFTIKLVREGIFDGLRIDHIDGLRDPLEYLQRLRKALPEDRWIPVYVEKILAGEALIDSFPSDGTFDGTTGYEFLNAVNWLMVRNIDKFEQVYRVFTGERRPLREIAFDLQYRVTDKDFTSETNRLTNLAFKAAQSDRQWDELTWEFLRTALREMASSLKVYRTYLGRFIDVESQDGLQTVIHERVNEARDEAVRRSPQLVNEIDFLTKLILEPSQFGPETLDHRTEFVLALQQYCGPLFAKGVEDWLFYHFHPLVQLGEVGGEPLPEPYALSQFNDDMQERAELWPRTLNTLSTHDTKRAADVRARLNALSEYPIEWAELLDGWSKHNLQFKSEHPEKGILVPDANGEYFIYQSLLGSFPNSVEEWETWKVRLQDYFQKAIREAKEHTNWIAPDDAYERLNWEFVERILSDQKFLSTFKPFAAKLAHFGMLNSLSQVALQMTVPGIPEIYQGTELLDLSLVDPDNRRPVDYEVRMAVLQEARDAVSRGNVVEHLELLKRSPLDGRFKLVIVSQLLNARAQYPVLCDGDYQPLKAEGRYRKNLIGFTRNQGSESAFIVIPRFYTDLVHEGQLACGTAIWGDTQIVMPPNLANTTWQNVITGETVVVKSDRVEVGNALSVVPVGVFVRIS